MRKRVSICKSRTILPERWRCPVLTLGALTPGAWEAECGAGGSRYSLASAKAPRPVLCSLTPDHPQLGAHVDQSLDILPLPDHKRTTHLTAQTQTRKQSSFSRIHSDRHKLESYQIQKSTAFYRTLKDKFRFLILMLHEDFTCNWYQKNSLRFRQAGRQRIRFYITNVM